MMGELFVVWFYKDHGWQISEDMSRVQAELYARTLTEKGYETRVLPRHTITLEDLILG